MLRFFWCLPLTALGAVAALLLALPCGGGVQRAQVLGVQAWWVSSPWTAAALQHHPAGPMLALCIGQVVISRAPLDCCDARLIRHELCHVRQAQRWGIAFPLAYLAASFAAWRRGEGAYWGNRFEREARAAEEQA